VIGRSWLKLIRHDRREDARRFYLRQFARRTPNTYCEFPVVDGHGHERWLGQNVRLLLSENGAPASFQASAREITDRKRTESELEKNCSFVERIAATTPGILYVYDLDERRNIFTNRGVVPVLGYKPEQQLESDALSRIHPDDAARVRSHRETLRAAAEGEIRRIEYRVRHADGHWVWLSARDTPFERARNGAVKRFVGIAQDITARKATQEKLTLRAECDGLTGLANRVHFLALLRSMLRRAAIQHGTLSFCALDVNRFREINERYGYSAGDTVLQAVADTIGAEVGVTALTGRIGGGDFAFVLRSSENREAEEKAVRICSRIAALEFNPGSFHVTVTFAISESKTGMGIDLLLDSADRALNKAKSVLHGAVCA